jgi:hypothetical protein
LPPSPRNAKHCCELTPASRRQDHTTSPSAIAPFVKSAIRVHRIRAQRLVTIAIRPSCGRGRAGLVEMICPSGKVENLCQSHWTRQANHASRTATSPKSSGCLLRVVTASRRHIESGKEKASQWVENRILLKPCVASSLTVVFDRNVRQQDASQGENQMKIQTVSVVLMSLVSGLAFTSPAMAAGARRCPPGHVPVGGQCLPEALVPIATAGGIDTSSCSITQATSTVHCSSIAMPRKSFERLIANQPPPRVVN